MERHACFRVAKSSRRSKRTKVDDLDGVNGSTDNKQFLAKRYGDSSASTSHANLELCRNCKRASTDREPTVSTTQSTAACKRVRIESAVAVSPEGSSQPSPNEELRGEMDEETEQAPQVPLDIVFPTDSPVMQEEKDNKDWNTDDDHEGYPADDEIDRSEIMTRGQTRTHDLDDEVLEKPPRPRIKENRKSIHRRDQVFFETMGTLRNGGVGKVTLMDDFNKCEDILAFFLALILSCWHFSFLNLLLLLFLSVLLGMVHPCGGWGRFQVPRPCVFQEVHLELEGVQGGVDDLSRQGQDSVRAYYIRFPSHQVF